MNTIVAFNTTTTYPPPTTVNFLTSSRHSRRLKLGIQLNQTKALITILSKKSFKSLKRVYLKKKSIIFEIIYWFCSIILYTRLLKLCYDSIWVKRIFLSKKHFWQIPVLPLQVLIIFSSLYGPDKDQRLQK